jgi:hypothetical protein
VSRDPYRNPIMTLTADQRARLDDPIGRAILACLAEAHREHDAAWLEGHLAWLDARDRAGCFAASAEAEAAIQWLLFVLSAHARGDSWTHLFEEPTEAQRRAKARLVAALERLVPRAGVSPMAVEASACTSKFGGRGCVLGDGHWGSHQCLNVTWSAAAEDGDS